MLFISNCSWCSEMFFPSRWGRATFQHCLHVTPWGWCWRHNPCPGVHREQSLVLLKAWCAPKITPAWALTAQVVCLWVKCPVTGSFHHMGQSSAAPCEGFIPPHPVCCSGNWDSLPALSETEVHSALMTLEFDFWLCLLPAAHLGHSGVLLPPFPLYGVSWDVPLEKI